MSWYYIIYCIIYVMVCMNVYVHTCLYTILYTHTYSIFICVQIYDNIWYIIIQYFFSTHKACHVANILSRLKAWVSGEGANSFPRSPQVGHLHRLIFVSIAWIFVDLWTSHQHVINCSSTFHNQKKSMNIYCSSTVQSTVHQLFITQKKNFHFH